MSRIVFYMTEDHIKLLTNLSWSTKDGLITGVKIDSDGEEVPPFGDDDLFSAIDLILNGADSKRINKDLNEPPNFSMEDILLWTKLYEELPLALSIILQNKTFEPGRYTCMSYKGIWEKF